MGQEPTNVKSVAASVSVSTGVPLVSRTSIVVRLATVADGAGSPPVPISSIVTTALSLQVNEEPPSWFAGSTLWTLADEPKQTPPAIAIEYFVEAELPDDALTRTVQAPCSI